MSRIYQDMTQLIGNTPLVEISRFAALHGVTTARVCAKLERFNPAGSAKDRVALSMIRDAERTGRLAPGGLIIEPTSGNTGIGITPDKRHFAHPVRRVQIVAQRIQWLANQGRQQRQTAALPIQITSIRDHRL